MKQKKILILTLVLLCCSLPTLFSTTCSAQTVDISITSVNAILLNTRTVGDTEIHTYRIIAVLYNNGNASSEEISVKFHDPGYNESFNPLELMPKNASLGPNGSKTFVFESWPTSLIGNIPINITFSPTSSSIQANQYNSGYYIYSLSIGSSKATKSTPGFEIAFVVLAIVILLSRKLKK